MGTPRKDIASSSNASVKTPLAKALIAVLAIIAAAAIIFFGFYFAAWANQGQNSSDYIAAPSWNTFESNRAYYATLTEREQQIYDAIETGLRCRADTIALPLWATTDECSNAYQTALLDNPDMIWTTPHYDYAVPLVESCVLISPQYTLDVTEATEAHTVLIKEIDDIVTSTKTEMAASGKEDDTEELCWALLEKEMKRLAYEGNDYDQSAYALVALDGKTVCAGYAKVYKLLCDAAGVRCFYISGTVPGDDDIRHAWNMFYLDDGTVMYVDPTRTDKGDEAWLKGAWFTDTSSMFRVPGDLSSKLPIVEEGKVQSEKINRIRAYGLLPLLDMG